MSIEAGTLREAEGKADAYFEDMNMLELADGFRILRVPRPAQAIGELLRWTRGDVQPL